MKKLTEVQTQAAFKSNLWVWQQAFALKNRFEKAPPKKGFVLFETGYGPSGLPHIGTFGEVFRTTMVRKAFEQICDIPTKMICVSDDMDGMRKVPDNLPNQEMLAGYINKPLTAVPDPFGTHESYGAHMNSRLRSFLDRFGFDYEFKSATDLYKSGAFDEKLLLALNRYQKIMDIMLPTLGEERQQTYSPFLPISPTTGNVLYVQTKPNPANGTVSFVDEDGVEKELPVTGGNCKLQWKPDFGMRWAALDVDFEMYGKDHLVNGKIYSAICKALDGTPPQQFNYELFLDEKGEKISKSKGNGISIEEWLDYGTTESLALYMFQSPQKAKKLHFDVIPKSVDEYISFAAAAHKPEQAEKVHDNPAYHIHNAANNNSGVPEHKLPLSFALLLNLASASNPDSKAVMWGFISNYASGLSPETSPYLDKLVELSIKYYERFVKPNKNFRAPSDVERAAIVELRELLTKTNAQATAEEIQTEVYNIGMKHGFANLVDWFKALYQVLLGADQGPRMGSFIKLYGIENTIKLIDEKLQ
jgi:lysyl-tRNA synthetase class 1